MKKLLYFILVLFPIAVLVIFPKWTVDDAYIYYRYADNFANHGELNWNVGQPPVEGYTGVALAIVLSAFIKAGFSPVTMSHVIGIASYFLGWLMLFLILRKFKVGTIGVAVGLSLYSTIPILFTHALSGLDTMPFLGLYLTCAYLFLWVIESPVKNQWIKKAIFFLALLILSLIRPEGVALSALFMIAAYYLLHQEQRKKDWLYILMFLIFYLFPASAYFLWRFHYYCQLLPNTFYAKTNVVFTLGNLMDCARFLIRYFALPVGVVAMLFGTDTDLIWKKIKNKEFFSNNKILIIFLLVNLLFVLLLILEFAYSHLSMNYANRFYVPILPLLWIVISLGVDWGWQAVKQTKSSNPLRYKFIIVFLLLAAVYQFAFHLTKLKEEVKFTHDYNALLNSEHIMVGKTLKRIMPPNEWLVSYIDAGAVPYFSGLKTVDFGGLNDRILVNNKLTDKERVDYFYSKNPGAVVFTSESSERLMSGSEAERITSDLRFNNYFLFQKYQSNLTSASDYYNHTEFLYIRKDLADKIKANSI